MTAHWNADDQTLLNILHREVVKRAYHRNKAALQSLHDTVKELEEQLETLSLSKEKQKAVIFASKNQGTEATRLRWLLNYRHQFATNVVALAQRAAFISLDDSDNLDATSTLSTISVGVASPSLSSMSFDTSTLLAILANDCNLSPLSATEEIKTPFYSKPNPSLVGLTVTRKTPLAVLMQIELGYKMLSFSEATMLLDETYRSIVSFSLSGKAISQHWTQYHGLGEQAAAGRDEPQVFAAETVLWTERFETNDKHVARVNDDTIVALRESESEDGSKLYRCVYLLFRVRTRNGFLICVQSVEAGRLTDPSRSCVSRDGKLVQWTELSGWFVFEPTTDGKTYDSLYKEGAQIDAKSMMVGPIFTLPSSSC
ncbi:unnamed protein product [Peronospora effusa]|nr:unnamed protein product [Peronospora effusa]